VRTILIEDDADLRREIGEYLRRRGHDVAECATFRAGHATLAAAEVDVVVCDVNLPDGNGIDLCHEAASRLPRCRWVLMSGAHDPTDLDKLDSIPGPKRWTILDKPVSMRALNEAIEKQQAD
jgi:DNA-binding NtrC family response regulator